MQNVSFRPSHVFGPSFARSNVASTRSPCVFVAGWVGVFRTNFFLSFSFSLVPSSAWLPNRLLFFHLLIHQIKLLDVFVLDRQICCFTLSFASLPPVSLSSWPNDERYSVLLDSVCQSACIFFPSLCVCFNFFLQLVRYHFTFFSQYDLFFLPFLSRCTRCTSAFVTSNYFGASNLFY